MHNKIQVVEGIRALYINEAPVLHTNVFLYRVGEEEEEEEEEIMDLSVRSIDFLSFYHFGI